MIASAAISAPALSPKNVGARLKTDPSLSSNMRSLSLSNRSLNEILLWKVTLYFVPPISKLVRDVMRAAWTENEPSDMKLRQLNVPMYILQQFACHNCK
jgi:hypothetical protein